MIDDRRSVRAAAVRWVRSKNHDATEWACFIGLGIIALLFLTMGAIGAIGAIIEFGWIAVVVEAAIGSTLWWVISVIHEALKGKNVDT